MKAARKDSAPTVARHARWSEHEPTLALIKQEKAAQAAEIVKKRDKLFEVSRRLGHISTVAYAAFSGNLSEDDLIELHAVINGIADDASSHLDELEAALEKEWKEAANG